MNALTVFEQPQTRLVHQGDARLEAWIGQLYEVHSGALGPDSLGEPFDVDDGTFVRSLTNLFLVVPGFDAVGHTTALGGCDLGVEVSVHPDGGGCKMS